MHEVTRCRDVGGADRYPWYKCHTITFLYLPSHNPHTYVFDVENSF
jgi:hypothetical protein